MKTNAIVLEHPIETSKFAEDNGIEFQEIKFTSPTGEEVLVEIAAASLCHTDVAIARGNMEESYPLVMGHEGAGIVRDIGDDVESLQPGDHVVLGRIACGKCRYCRMGRSNLCQRRTEARRRGTLRTGEIRFSRDGSAIHHCHGVSSFTEHTIVTENVAIQINDDVPLEQATLLGCGVFTGAGAVMNTADVEAGSSIVVFGTGGVGMSAIQGAKIRGATTIIAVDVIPEKLEVAAELGATHTIDASIQQPVQQIQKLVGGVEYSFDTVGQPEVTDQAVDVLGPTGTAVLVGTPSVGKQELNIDTYDLVVSEKTLTGSFNGSYNLSLAIPRLADLVAAGELNLDRMITETRPMAEVNQAMDDLKSGVGLRQVLIP